MGCVFDSSDLSVVCIFSCYTIFCLRQDNLILISGSFGCLQFAFLRVPVCYTSVYCSTFYHRQKEYDTAIQQYVKTIGILEASFVIQRFLEGGHIVQLAYYLEALDSAGLASSDHLVLLLNCYARLQDKERIAQFVQGPVRPQLNVSTAIQVLRQASYPQAALKLAEACNRFVDQVGILIEDMDDCAGALASIERFPFDEVRFRCFICGGFLYWLC
ncbi:hypothetical protein PHET_11589 [Paragonimus heterotremus]|uniref:Uncharacterized protein n=1 Tax=Paragonimus heterotremus TaxID=100268 RepID=A0A8J4WM77_9TREM|nr:hypothetical protein PHET_11589 [Paragonimus heterotremus]